jgi:flagellar biosynthesis protein FlhG
LLALAFAADGRRTLLIDTDDNIGVQHRVLGVSGAHGFASLQDPGVSAADAILPVADQCWLVPGGIGGDPNQLPLGTSERRAVFRRVAQLYPEFDIVVIDAGSRLDGILAAAGRGAWRFLAVAGVEPVALASAYAFVKAVETRWTGASIEVLINRHDDARARRAFEQIHAASMHFLSRSIGFAGAVPLDPELAAATAAGDAIDVPERRSLATRAARSIAVRLLAELDDVARAT